MSHLHKCRSCVAAHTPEMLCVRQLICQVGWETGIAGFSNWETTSLLAVLTSHPLKLPCDHNLNGSSQRKLN